MLLWASLKVLHRTKATMDNQETTVAAESAPVLKTPASQKEMCAAHMKRSDDFKEPRPEP